VQLATLNLPMDWQGCAGCRVTATGIGFDLDYRLTRLVYLDSELNFFPGTPERGAVEEGLLGVKVGHTARSWGVFAQLRPGFVHYEKTLLPGSSSEYEDATRFAFDCGRKRGVLRIAAFDDSLQHGNDFYSLPRGAAGSAAASG
jgi:hypothetical protein